MDTIAVRERRKYEQMWTFGEYRDDHATRHANAALDALTPDRGESVIDFGAGAGYASRRLRDAGLGVLAIDIAANAMAADIAATVPRLIGNMWDIPVDLQADWGLCCDVMEHIPPERVQDVLRFIRRSTRRSTYFHVSLRADGCGRLIGESLHLTVEPLEWWTRAVTAHWAGVRVLAHAPGDSATLVADGRTVAEDA
jgi:SAM-dependent methyltransferase